jgi:hypothetical protein
VYNYNTQPPRQRAHKPNSSRSLPVCPSLDDLFPNEAPATATSCCRGCGADHGAVRRLLVPPPRAARFPSSRGGTSAICTGAAGAGGARRVGYYAHAACAAACFFESHGRRAAAPADAERRGYGGRVPGYGAAEAPRQRQPRASPDHTLGQRRARGRAAAGTEKARAREAAAAAARAEHVGAGVRGGQGPAGPRLHLLRRRGGRRARVHRAGPKEEAVRGGEQQQPGHGGVDVFGPAGSCRRRVRGRRRGAEAAVPLGGVGQRGRRRGQEGAAQLADPAGWRRQRAQGAPPDVGAHRGLRCPVTESTSLFLLFF